MLEQLQLALDLTSSPEEKHPLDMQAKLYVPSLKHTLSRIGLGKDMVRLPLTDTASYNTIK